MLEFWDNFIFQFLKMGWFEKSRKRKVKFEKGCTLRFEGNIVIFFVSKCLEANWSFYTVYHILLKNQKIKGKLQYPQGIRK